MLNLVSLSTQSLASCVNYFCLELFTVFFQHENRFRYKFFRYCSIFKVLCASALAADDLIILPQKRFFVKHFFEKLLKFFELGALRTSQCQLVFFSVYWFFFKGFLLSFQKSFFCLSAWRSSIIPHTGTVVNTF